MREVFLVESVRTGIAKAGKNSWFANLRADDMAALVMNEVIRRAGMEDKKEEIGDVILGGTALMKDMGSNIGRYATIMAGLPYSIPGVRRPLLRIGAANDRYGHRLHQYGVGGSHPGRRRPAFDPYPHGHHVRPEPTPQGILRSPMISMGYTAEMVARKYGITRQEQDQLAVESHAKPMRLRRKDCLRMKSYPLKPMSRHRTAGRKG